MFPWYINVMSLFSRISGADVALYQLSIHLKADVQELNDDQLEQLMSRFGGFDLVVDSIPLTAFSTAPRYSLLYPIFLEPWKVQQSSEGHNGYNTDKENDRHGKSSNDVSRLEPLSWYNQSAGGEHYKFNSPDFLASWTTYFQESEMLHHFDLVHSFSSIEVE
ncbi:hypothetical protein F3Y22_tig00117048pilonHSYRG00415 [Hibiscus syriacus]|uniref:Uncharacterized protein n=1 Tax=Hibiscus syriacus TaxID=106335 RepID=A0A6A2X7V7_HIBSY|nr:hypothetical protein F3Y22_tig00117048pilonHSYRG00415 [Hibiscus syriacus]